MPIFPDHAKFCRVLGFSVKSLALVGRMSIVSRLGFRPVLKVSCAVLALVFLSGQASLPPQHATLFPYEHTSYLYGVLNTLNGFRLACLRQPVTRDLPAKIVPDDYRVVTFAAHMGWEKDGQFADRMAILSKTGLEQDDWDNGFPIVDFTMPRDTDKDGRCGLVWKRPWDERESGKTSSISMAALLDARISYYLSAVRLSRPDWTWKPVAPFGGVSHWVARCWGDYLCHFTVTAIFHEEDGINLSIRRDRTQLRAPPVRP